MLKVFARLMQNPVLLSPSCANISCSMIPLVGHVSINSSKRQKIGGVRVVLESRVQRRVIGKRDGKSSWTEGDTIDKYEVDVIQGPYYLAVGETQFEFVLEVPVTMVSSRITAFDKISYHLLAALLDITPCYDRLAQPESGLSTFRYSLPMISYFAGYKKASRANAFGMTPVIRYSTTPITVWSCDTEGESTAYNFAYQTEMEDLGHLDLGISSQQLVLGQTASLNVKVSGLSPQTTVHNMTVNLVQVTKKAICPSKYSSSSSISYDDRTSDEIIDSFQLHTFGIPWPFMYSRPRPYRGSYIWRGSEAARYTSERLGMADLRADTSTDDGFELSTILTIPSPIILALNTTTGCDPAFATVSHHLDIKFTYSILGIGSGGLPLPHVEGEPEEGVVRSWTLEKTLEVHSDLSSATATAAPPYSPTEETTHHCISAAKMNLKSTKACRSTSLGQLYTTWMRPVRMTEAHLRERTQMHWDETGGLCACFDQSEVCGCARREIVLRRQELILGQK